MSVAIRKALNSDLETILNLYADLESGGSRPLGLRDAERIFERMQGYYSYAPTSLSFQQHGYNFLIDLEAG